MAHVDKQDRGVRGRRIPVVALLLSTALRVFCWHRRPSHPVPNTKINCMLLPEARASSGLSLVATQIHAGRYLTAMTRFRTMAAWIMGGLCGSLVMLTYDGLLLLPDDNKIPEIIDGQALCVSIAE